MQYVVISRFSAVQQGTRVSYSERLDHKAATWLLVVQYDYSVRTVTRSNVLLYVSEALKKSATRSRESSRHVESVADRKLPAVVATYITV
jgi:hypothetical protein